jgi:type VI secretion system protein ImpE
MTPSELYKAGRLAEAIDAQVQEVKKAPGDQARRLFLFELLIFAGQWDRARRQIEAVKYDELELESATAKYRKLLESEEARRKLFADGVRPKFFVDPPAHTAHRLEAVDCLRNKDQAGAAAALAKAQEAAPHFKGTLNGKPFESLRDCDDLFGDVLEVFAQGGYFWVPLAQVEDLALNPPRFPRDLIWAPARLDMHDGASGEVFLPALYPDSAEHADDPVKLGRATDWNAPEGGPVLGRGARLFLVGDDALPLLEWRELKLEATA